MGAMWQSVACTLQQHELINLVCVAPELMQPQIDCTVIIL